MSEEKRTSNVIEFSRAHTLSEKKCADSKLQEIYDLYLELNNALSELSKEWNEDASDAIVQSLSRTLTVVSQTPSTTVSDVAIKLAIWCRENPEIISDTPQLSCTDAIAYSALKDLIRIVGEKEDLWESRIPVLP